MKKTTFIFFIFACLLRITSAQAQLITAPGTSENDYYLIKHVSTNTYLSYSGGNDAPVISALTDADATQYFQFKLVAGTTDIYNILNVEANKYVARKDAGNAWSMIWVADPNDANNWGSGAAADVKQNAQFKITAGGDGTYIRIQNVAGAKYMKSSPSDNTVVYADGGDTSSDARWFLSIPSGDTDKTALQAVYDAALALYNNTVAGNGSDQYPADKRTTLWERIQDALDIIDNPSASQSEVNSIAGQLDAALAAYKASVNPFLPDGNAIYYIQNAGGSGCYLSTNSITIVAATFAIDQQFKFVRFQNSNYFNIVKASAPTQLLTRQDNAYGLGWGSEQSDLAQFIFKSTGEGSYTIECLGLIYKDDGTLARANSFMGAESNSDGSGVFIDKDGKDGKHKWKIIDISTLGLVTTALENAITKAQEEFLNYAQKGDGPDQYPAAEYDALVNAIAAGNAILANQTGVTQTQVGDATLAINNALAAVRILANPFSPDVTKDYQVVHYGGLFLNAKPFEGYEAGTDKANALEIANRSDADNQKIKFLTGQNGLNITFASVSDKYLTRCTDEQVNNASQIDDYKLVWLEDATSDFAQFEIKRAGVKDYYTVKCITIGPKRSTSYLGTDATTAGSGVSIDKSGTETNHYWKVQTFGEESAIKPAAVNNVAVFTNNGYLTINQLEGANRIAIYNIVGQLVANVSTTGSKFETQLPKGIYVVTVNGDSSYRGKAIVK
ncbi:MAG: DUF6383 domain-containing protein [Dysgonamonadaceae bacterium]|jgi:hypothetical protein|nr:DUF6383 domain-containing protein [Dysgonamonadaceae bacterium]